MFLLKRLLVGFHRLLLAVKVCQEKMTRTSTPRRLAALSSRAMTPSLNW